MKPISQPAIRAQKVFPDSIVCCSIDFEQTEHFLIIVGPGIIQVLLLWPSACAPADRGLALLALRPAGAQALGRRSLKVDPLGELAAVSFPNAALEDPGTSQDVWLKRPRGEAVVIDDEVRTFWPLE